MPLFCTLLTKLFLIRFSITNLSRSLNACNGVREFNLSYTVFSSFVMKIENSPINSLIFILKNKTHHFTFQPVLVLTGSQMQGLPWLPFQRRYSLRQQDVLSFVDQLDLSYQTVVFLPVPFFW